jgi:hypothetical protein
VICKDFITETFRARTRLAVKVAGVGGFAGKGNSSCHAQRMLAHPASGERASKLGQAVARKVSGTNQRVQEDRQMPKQGKQNQTTGSAIKDTITSSGEAASRSGKGGKGGGGMGGQQPGGIKGGGKRSTHVGDKKGSPGGLTSD